jgi:YcaO-like protein with predicted kinase domain
MNLELAGPGLKHPSVDSGRTRSSQATLRSIEPLKHRFGITRVADVTGLDRIGIPVAIATRPAARSVAVSQGKGLDHASARVSALMEAIEVWHAENIAAPLVMASIRDVSETGRSCDVGRLPMVARQARPDHARLLWIWGEDLVSNQPKLVPFEMVHADYAPPVKPGHGLFPASTNGLASGNHPLEAASAALSEIIERDSMAVWHQRSLAERAATRLELATIDHPACRTARDLIADADLDLAIWDVTSDVGVAAFLCLLHDPRADEEHIGLGSGAHPDAGVALARAITEAAQTRLTYIAGSRDDLNPDEFTPFGYAQKRRLTESLLRAGPPARNFADVGSHASDTLQEDLAWLIERLVAVGIEEVVVVDLTKSEVGIPVARVIVPGLEAPHDDSSYVAGPRALAAAAERTE